MSHSIGSVVAQAPAFAVGPGSGMPPNPAGVWERTFSPPAASGGTKFLMLHFTGATLGAGDRVEVVRSGDPDPFHALDVFTSAHGPSFWSRPVSGNSVVVRFIDGGDGTGQASITEYGRSEGLRLGGADFVNGGNANGDVFMLDASWDEPTFHNAAGICPSGANPSWENVAVLPAGVMRDTARKVGMILHVEDGTHLSTCTATLIAPDLILTAAHCLDPGAVASCSFTLDFETDGAGNRPPGYAPRFYRLTRFVRGGFQRAPGDTRPGRDYAVAEIATPAGGLGVAPAVMRTSLPATGDEVFVVHHPRATAKKISRRPADPAAGVGGVFADANLGTVVQHDCDIDNGSSGSSLFDTAGRIVAINDWAFGACNGRSLSIIDVQQDFLTAPPPPKDVDVMLVFDRSGSMSLPSHTAGMTKIEHARRAVALFVDLIRKDRSHRIGLVTFSTTAAMPPAFVGLRPATDPNEQTLIGPPPHNAGLVAAIVPDGVTSIGAGLSLAQAQFPAVTPATNTRTILLLTDGLQNTPPMIADVEASLGGTQLSVLGFGTAASIDSGLLTRLARDHSGLFSRAEDGLSLRKFFVLAFGNIFESGISMDPLYELPAGATEAAPIELRVCGESRLTVVLGWEQPESRLLLSLVTPGGTVVDAATAGLVASAGDTWAWLRLPLPFAGERDGTWQIKVSRRGGGGELAVTGPNLAAERFFVSSVIDGGPYLRPLTQTRRYYTGDVVNPLVQLRHPEGEHVEATMTLEVEVPDDGAGNILTTSGLGTSREVDGDVLDARVSALTALEDDRGGPVVGTTLRTFELFDDAEHDDLGMEPDGIFGNPLPDLMRTEGTYTFRAVAEFGDGCTARRETFWSAHADVGIDPVTTTVTTSVLGTEPDGRRRVQVTVTPRDRFGNHVGPGRVGDLGVAAPTGGELSGDLVDQGDGSYGQVVLWDPASSIPPGLVITQPERPPVVVVPPAASGSATPFPWLLWLLLLLVLVLLAIVVVLLVT